MNSTNEPALYKIWALDDVVYGPVEVETLKEWASDERVQSDTWVFCLRTRIWVLARQIPELRSLFDSIQEVPEAADDPLRPGVLRRIRALADLTDEQLRRFATFAQYVRFPAYTPIMRVGQPGDAVYFVLEGEVRQRILVKERELLIGVQQVGGVFGQISIFDGGPRVSDAISDGEVALVKVSMANFRRLCRVEPDIAIPVLLAFGRTLAARIRTDDKHLCEAVAMTQTAS